MPRIVAGVAGGRRLRVPLEGTRPTSDRVREAVFNAVISRIELDGARHHNPELVIVVSDRHGESDVDATLARPPI